MKTTKIALIYLAFAISSNAQWSLLTTGVTENLNAIQFLDINRGFVVGKNGCFIQTSDGGTTWTYKNLPTSGDLHSVYFLDADTGFVCSNNHIFRTTNGGVSFMEITSILQHPLNPLLPMNEIKMSFNGRIGIITCEWYGDTTVSVKSNDAGNTWQAFIPPHITLYSGVDFSIVSTNVIYAIRIAQQYKTVDGGANWIIIRNLPFSITGKNGFKIFNSAGLGYANCAYGTALVSFYNDLSDTTIPHGSLTDPHSFSFINSDTGFFLKYNVLYKTTDRGITKTIVDTFTSFTDPYKWQVCFVNDNIGFICGEKGKIYKTISGGSTSINSPTIKKKVRLYPNPSNQSIFLDFSKDIEIQKLQLVDITGKVIKNYDPNYRILDVMEIDSGQYVLRICTDKSTQVEKIEIR